MYLYVYVYVCKYVGGGRCGVCDECVCMCLALAFQVGRHINVFHLDCCKVAEHTILKMAQSMWILSN